MAKINRFDGDVKAFASNETAGERLLFGSDTLSSNELTDQLTTEALRGWGTVGNAEFPPIEWFNALGFTVTQFNAYLHQMGIAEYNAAQEYHIDSICTYSGKAYKSTSNSNVGNQPDSLSGWVVAFDSELSQIARSLNILDSDVGYDTSGLIVKDYIYSSSQQVIYSVPASAIGKTISSVVGSTLTTTTEGPYPLTKVDNTSGLDPYKSGSQLIMDIFVVYGQSNSIGFANNTEGRRAPLEGTFYWDGSAISAPSYTMSTAQLESSTGHAWVAFGNEYLRLTGRRVLIVPCGKGAQQISSLSKGTQIYTDMLSYVAAAKSAIVPAGYTVGKTAVLFHQGETDMLNELDRNSYQALFDTLITDMTTDLATTYFFNHTVGNPQNRQERTIQSIQNAQRYGTRNNVLAYTAFDGCGSFTQANGMLLPDGVHYTQQGYNYMGEKSAITVSNVLRGDGAVGGKKLVATESDLKNFSIQKLPQDQEWESVSAAAVIDSGSFVLRSNDYTDNLVRLSNVTSITLLSDRVRFNLACNADRILKLNTYVNNNGVLNNITTAATVGEDVGTGRWYVDVFLYMDLNFAVQGLTNTAVKGPTGNSSAFLDSILTITAVSADITRIDHPYSAFFGNATPYGKSDNTEFNIIAFSSNGSTEGISGQTKRIGWQVSDTYRVAYVSIPRCLINPSTLTTEFNGLQVYIDAIVSEFAE